MKALDSEALGIAIEAFIASMRREWVGIAGTSGKECPVQTFDRYPLAQRRALARSIHTAILAADPENVKSVQERRAG